MAEELSFTDLIQRVRAGDEKAATELVRRYEPAIRVAVRVRLTDPGLRRFLDSMDICQSVLANFFVRAAAGQFDLDKQGKCTLNNSSICAERLPDNVEPLPNLPRKTEDEPQPAVAQNKAS